MEYFSTGTTDLSGNTVDLSGNTGDLSGAIIQQGSQTISLEELLHEHTILVQKENSDEQTILDVFGMSLEQLRSKLLDWAKVGLTDMFPIGVVSVNPPPVCSDGLTRSFIPYIEYVTSLTIPELLQMLIDKVTDIQIVFSYSGNVLTVYCSKP